MFPEVSLAFGEIIRLVLVIDAYEPRFSRVNPENSLSGEKTDDFDVFDGGIGHKDNPDAGTHIMGKPILVAARNPFI